MITYSFPYISIPAPVGGATEAKQDTQITLATTANSSLSSIDGKFTTLNAKDFSTSAKQDTGNASLSSIDGKFTTLNAKDFATSAKQDTLITNTTNIPNVIATEGGAQPSHGIVVMGHNGAGVSRHIRVDGNGRIDAVINSSALPTGAATEAKQDAEIVLLGGLTETAPATDTASSGLNGRLQRIAQRFTSLIALLPSSIGQKASADSLSVAIASDQAALSVTQTALSATFQEDSTVSTTAETFTAPAGAKWCKIQAPSSNTVNLRVKIGGTASTTSGLVLEPGRSEDFMAAGNISYCSESGSGQAINAHFGA